jgi:hypothetical protein
MESICFPCKCYIFRFSFYSELKLQLRHTSLRVPLQRPDKRSNLNRYSPPWEGQGVGRLIATFYDIRSLSSLTPMPYKRSNLNHIAKQSPLNSTRIPHKFPSVGGARGGRLIATLYDIRSLSSLSSTPYKRSNLNHIAKQSSPSTQREFPINSPPWEGQGVGRPYKNTQRIQPFTKKIRSL